MERRWTDTPIKDAAHAARLTWEEVMGGQELFDKMMREVEHQIARDLPYFQTKFFLDEEKSGEHYRGHGLKVVHVVAEALRNKGYRTLVAEGDCGSRYQRYAELTVSWLEAVRPGESADPYRSEAKP